MWGSPENSAMRKLFFLLLLFAFSRVPAWAETPPPRLFLSAGGDLVLVKKRLADDRKLASAVAELRRRADQELTGGPYTIVNKPQAPPSGDKHDYVSMAPYFWPDPNKKDGLP